MDNVAEEVGGLVVCLGTPQRTIRVIPLRGKTEWDIVVSLGQTWSLKLIVIVQDIEASLAHICVFGGVVDGMIVVPERTGVLSIGIIVVLVGVGLGGVLGPSVEGCPRCRNMLVTRVN